jgi:demethylmenaquinone methyltransferase/2-methoxy-6-polyprenyl-1,4-benzoquinol methylase
MEAQKDIPAPSRHKVWQMFDRIAHRYDLLNHLLSANQDRRWRSRVNRHLPDGSRLRVLDLATGTADQLLAAYNSGRMASGIGIDPAEKMLEIGREKIRFHGLERILTLQTGQAEQTGLPDCSFDVVTISFGIRNVSDVPAALAEMYRVLRPGGRALILEFSLPRNPLIRKMYLFYFRHILPRLGAAISGDAHAYRYLNQTVETFPYGENFCSLMRDAGFSEVDESPLTFGVATIYQGDRPS